MRLACLLLLTASTVLAQPAASDCQPGAEAVRAALAALRAQPQQCGTHLWPAVPALRESPALATTALRFAQALAARDRIEHVGAAGDSLRARLRDAGYAMRLSAENLAGGPETLDEALAQWLASPAHCENLMLAEVQEFGLACVSGPGRFQRYWVLHLAAPAGGPPAR